MIIYYIMKNTTTVLVRVKGKPVDTPPTTTSLTDEEHDNLEQLETQIADNVKSAFTLAAALAEIREKKLYRENYKTFEEYCKQRWDYSRSYCERLADMNDVLVDLKEYEDHQVFPRNELQARVFVPLEKEQRITLFKTVLAESETDRTTASEFTKYRKKLFPCSFGAEAKKPKTKPKMKDVDTTVHSIPAIPSIIKIVDSANEVLEGLLDEESDNKELLGDLRKFIKLAEPLVEWQKANLK
jgi:hypothetical protein